MVREDLAEFVTALTGDLDYETLHNRAEYRAALAYQFGRTNDYRGHPLAGEFIGEQMWIWGDPQQPAMGVDFQENGDHEAWRRDEANEEWFSSEIENLHAELRALAGN